MNPLGWVIGHGLAVLLALLGPLILSAILYRFLRKSARTWVLTIATACGVASFIWTMLESTDQPLGPMLILVAFVMPFGAAALVCSAIALLARFLIWLWYTASVTQIVSRLRIHERANK